MRSGGKCPVSPILRNTTCPLGFIVNQVIPQLPILMRSQPSHGNCRALETQD